MAQSRLTPLGDDTLHRPRRESETSVRSKPKNKVPFTPGKRDARPLGIQPSCVPCDPSDMYRESVRPRGMDTSHCPKFHWTHSTRIADRVFVPREWIAFQIFPRTHSPRIARMFVHLFKGKPWRVTHPENFGIGTRESI